MPVLLMWSHCNKLICPTAISSFAIGTVIFFSTCSGSVKRVNIVKQTLAHNKAPWEWVVMLYLNFELLIVYLNLTEMEKCWKKQSKLNGPEKQKPFGKKYWVSIMYAVSWYWQQRRHKWKHCSSVLWLLETDAQNQRRWQEQKWLLRACRAL